MAKERRTRHELRRGHDPAKSAQEAQRLLDAWRDYVATGKALAAIRPCGAVWPSSVQDVAPVRCQLLEGHAQGEDDGGHRHRILGSQVVVTW